MRNKLVEIVKESRTMRNTGKLLLCLTIGSLVLFTGCGSASTKTESQAQIQTESVAKTVSAVKPTATPTVKPTTTPAAKAASKTTTKKAATTNTNKSKSTNKTSNNNSSSKSSSSSSSSSKNNSSSSTASTYNVYSTSDQTCTAVDCNFRETASTNGAILDGIPAGTVLEQTGYTDNGWLRVKYNGMTGYIADSCTGWDVYNQNKAAAKKSETTKSNNTESISEDNIEYITLNGTVDYIDELIVSVELDEGGNVSVNLDSVNINGDIGIGSYCQVSLANGTMYQIDLISNASKEVVEDTEDYSYTDDEAASQCFEASETEPDYEM